MINQLQFVIKSLIIIPFLVYSYNTNAQGTCSNPIPITCGSTTNGTTVDGTNVFNQYGCDTQAEGGKEKVHSIVLTQTSDITATLSNLNGQDLDIHILNDCDETNAAACLARGDNFATATNQPAGTYFIIVDGYTGGGQTPEGTFTLDVTCTPNGGGSTTGNCTSPIALTCGAPFNGTTTDGESNFNTYSCTGGQQEAGKEKIHTITITQPSDLVASITNLNGVDLDIHILGSCDATDCIARDNATATATGLAAGTYFIVVDGFGASGVNEGTYTLEVTCTPNSSGPTTGICSSPIALTCGTPFNGNTTGYPNNLSDYNCTFSTDKLGPEVIHTITSPGNGTLSATLISQSGEDLEVGILSSCSESGCLDITNASSSVSISNATAGTQYFIVVDGDEADDFGTYTLEVTCPPSSTTGDCNTPIALTCGSPFNGTTVDGVSNFNTYSCTGGQQEAGKEKIHTITITQPSDLTASITNLNGVDLDIHILGSCDATDCIARDNSTATATGLVAGTYFVVVDGFGASGANEGTYTLEVNCTPNGGTGGTCSSPIALTCGTSFSGNTTGLTDEISNYNCGGSTNVGPDAIHTITSPGNGTLTATLTRPNGIDMEVAILSSCNGSTCLDKTQFATGTSISASISNATAGTQYFIVVDGDVAADFGPYSIEVTCPPSTQTGDCTNPIVLSCGNPFSGTTVDGVSNFNTYSCAGGQQEAGKEKIHTITITQPSDLTASITNLNGVDLDIHILGSCDATDCIARDNATATATGLAAGTYYIVVDGFGASGVNEGAYTLEVTCTPNGGTGGTCSSPIALTCGTSFSGNTTGLTDEISNYNCGGSTNVGPDAIHTITSPGNGTLTATLTRPNGIDMEVAILSSCDGSTCLDKTQFATGTSISASISNATAGTQYFIVVDGDVAADFGPYSIEVTCPPSTQTGDCTNPIILSCGSPFSGTTVDGVSNFNTYSCAGGQQEAGKEKIHTITITQPSDLTASITNLNGVDLDIHILGSCDATDCIARDNATATATGLAAGTYFIVVDGFGASGVNEGAYTLEVTCNSNSNAGTCGDPIVLACGSPYSGNTTGSQNNLGNYSCSSIDKIGPEVIHTITSPGNGTLTATLTRQSGEDLEVGILSSCNESGCLDITSAGFGSTVTASISNAVAGTQYFIVVDGDEADDFGTYTLDVTCPPSSQTGDCNAPIVLSCGTPINGTTVDGVSNFNTYSCAGGQQEAGKEKIHTITLTQASDITASITNLNGVDLDIHILGSCDATDCIARDNATATATGLAAGTYFIVVDGFGVSGVNEGTYTLEVTCSPNIPSGPGSCSDPLPLTCGTPFTGNTSDGESNFSNYSCDPSKDESGKEKVHTITLTQASDITATISGMTADLDIQVLSACDQNSCLGRGDLTTTVNALAAGTYFIVVDGFGAAGVNEGAYTVQVDCTPINGGGNNNNCSELYFSEYIEGSSNNKALEVYNPSTSAINLSNYRIEIFSNGSSTASSTIPLSGSLASFGTFVIANNDNNNNAALLSAADLTSGSLTFNGDDAVVLLSTTDTVDIIGKIGEDPGTEWVNSTESTLDNTLYRMASVNQGVSSNPSTFNPSTEWVAIGLDNFSDLGFHTSDCQNVCVPNGSSPTEAICQGDTYIFGTQSLTTAGSYSETFTNVGGCDSVVNLTLSVNPLPTINAGSDVVISSGTSTVLSGSGGVSYVWDNNVTDGVAFTPAGTNNYTVTGTDANGCQNTDNVTVTVTGGVIPPCSELFISEYLEGSSQNKAIEIYNPTSGPVNLGAYSLLIYTNGASTSNPPITLSGSLAANSTYVIVNNSANTNLLALATIGSNALSFNGDDAIVLLKNSTDTIDIVGVIGQDPGTNWSGGSVSTVNMTIVRKASVQRGINTNPTTFDPSTEWDALPLDDISDIGNHTSGCSVNPCIDQQSISETICEGNTYVFNGQTLTTSGSYTETLTNAAGCDSITTLQLTVTPTQNPISETICSGASYVLGSQTLTVTGTYNETFQNTIGCDSTVILTLTVNPAVSSNVTETVCTSPYVFGSQSITQDGNYTEVFQTAQGCDSTVQLTITFGTAAVNNIVEEICQGETYVLGTQSLTTTGSYTEIFSSAGGCDSTVNLTLSVKATPLITVTESNGDLVSSNGTSYQWSLDGVVIPGATQQNISPDENGVYSVETTAFNGCVATGVYNLENVSIEELLSSNNVSIIPNPSKGRITITAFENVEVTVFNVIGEVVYSNSSIATTHVIDLTQNERGVYMVKVTNGNNKTIVKRVVLN